MKKIWGSIEAHAWWWSGGLLLLLTVFPQIDLAVSSVFYDPDTGTWPAKTTLFCQWAHAYMPYAVLAVPEALLLAWLATPLLRRLRPAWVVPGRVIAYLLLTLGLGPGLVVNALLKDNWGRPRPSTISEFGGLNTHIPPLWISNQCDTNCSFSSGHSAVAFWVVALAFLAPPNWRKSAIFAALGFGTLMGLARIAQGAHFFSDVAYSGVIVTVISWIFYCWLIKPTPLEASLPVCEK